MKKRIYNSIDIYYTNKINEYGTTPKGVDWNSEESQFIRFEQLSKIINSEKFSIADIGCGYGKYIDYLEKNYSNYNYTGYDLSNAMIDKATEIYPNKQNVSFKYIDSLNKINDSNFTIASGIFNVKMEYKESEWLSYILNTLEQINQKSINGFSFNMLTKYSDEKFMKENLYYADPLFIFDFCKRNFAKNVSLNHDYDLYEFTVLVKK